MIGLLPQEIWVECVTLSYSAGKEYNEMLLNLSLVSRLWSNALLNCPLLWAKLHIDGTCEDFLATIALFLSLSGSSPLSLSVAVPFLAWEPVGALLAPHRHRVNEVVLQPGGPEYVLADRDFANTLDVFLQKLGPFPSLRSIDVATYKPIQLGKDWNHPSTLVSTGNWVVPSSALRHSRMCIRKQRGIIVHAGELIDAGSSLSAMVSLETLEVYSTEHECIHPNTVPTGNVSFTVPRLKALRYQGQMHWVSEKLLSSVSQTVQHLEIKIVVQDLEYTVRCLGAASALRSLALSILALDSSLQLMSRGPVHLPLSVANWKTRMTRSSDSTVGHDAFKCRILDITNDNQGQNLWRAFHHTCPRVVSLLQRLPLVSAAIRFGILGQKDLDNRPANGILPVIPEEAWEAPASKYPTNITEATIAEAIIVDIMNSAHLTGIGHSPDYTMYAMPRNPEGALRFHWGEPIPILWRAPLDHSRKAWIGIYQDGANPHEVTTAKSEGRWVTLHAEEWDGDIPLPEHPIEESEMAECGEVAFRRFALPWETGQYELRYHRDGAYQMVSELRQVEIYLDRPKQIDPESLWKWLLRIVCLALDSDPDLVPRSALLTGDPTPPSHDLRMDDFRFWTNGNGKPTLRQAKRIAYAIEEALEIQLPADEIFGQPNVTILTRRILNLMSSPRSPTYPVDPTSLRSPFAPRKRRSRSTSQERMLSQNIFR